MVRRPTLLVRALGLALGLVLGTLSLLPPAARADEAPGVYDVQLDRAVYPASGSMTVTWRFVAPAGTTPASAATCSIRVGGVEKASATCYSGQAFSYDVGNLGYTTDAEVDVQAISFDTTLAYVYDGSTGTAFDTVAPNAAVTKFTADNGFEAQQPMPPGTVFGVVMHANDNLGVTSAHCSLERVSPEPAGFVQSVPCPSVLNPGTQNFFTTPSTSGEYTYVLLAGDPAGNTTRATRSFTVDATPPAVTMTSGPANGSATSQAHPAWTWTSDDDAASYTCSLHVSGSVGTPTACTSPYTVDAALADGTGYTFDLTATDTLGNAATTSRTFTYDVSAPVLSITGGPAEGATVASNHVAYGFTADEPSAFQCWWGQPGATPTYSACTSGQAVTLPGNGTYVFAFRAVDAAGNVGDPVLRTVTVAVPAPDTTAPRVTVLSRPAKVVRLARGHRTRAVKVRIAVSESCTVRYRLDRGPWRTGSTLRTVKVRAGKHTLTIVAVDRAGNRSRTTVVSWRVRR